MQKISIILAGGEGKRFGLTKQFVPINNIPLFIYTLKIFKNIPKILVVPKKFKDITISIIEQNNINDVKVIEGGNSRQKSVYNALSYLKEQNYKGKVIITDANRPLLKTKTIIQCFDYLKNYDGIITVCKSINTTCRIKDKKLEHIYDRTYMFDLLMPQCFDFNKLYKAHKNTKLKNATDDTQILLSYNKNAKIKTIEISFWEGLKLTHLKDYKIFKYLLKEEK